MEFTVTLKSGEESRVGMSDFALRTNLERFLQANLKKPEDLEHQDLDSFEVARHLAGVGRAKVTWSSIQFTFSLVSNSLLRVDLSMTKKGERATIFLSSHFFRYLHGQYQSWELPPYLRYRSSNWLEVTLDRQAVILGDGAQIQGRKFCLGKDISYCYLLTPEVYLVIARIMQLIDKQAKETAISKLLDSPGPYRGIGYEVLKHQEQLLKQLVRSDG